MSVLSVVKMLMIISTASVNLAETKSNLIESILTAEKITKTSGNLEENRKFDGAFLQNMANDGSFASEKRRMTTVGGVEDLPFIEYAHTVEFHFLLSSLPYNTDPAVANLFSEVSDGTELPSFHVGLGIWDTFTDTKISIEYVPANLLSSLLPTLSPDGRILWQNSGFIAVTNPMSASTSGYAGNWRESRLVSTSSGEEHSLTIYTVSIFF